MINTATSRGSNTLWCDQLIGDSATIREAVTATCASAAPRRSSWYSSAAVSTIVTSARA